MWVEEQAWQGRCGRRSREGVVGGAGVAGEVCGVRPPQAPVLVLVVPSTTRPQYWYSHSHKSPSPHPVPSTTVPSLTIPSSPHPYHHYTLPLPPQ